MRPTIEAHYLSIEWQDPGRARRIEVAPEPMEIQSSADGVMTVETQIFNDFHPWLGLRLNGVLADATPMFINAQGAQCPMLSVHDGQGSVWWVQDDGWDAARQRHLSELHRTMGRFEILVGGQSLFVENVATDLSRTQIEEYLQDFKQDLVWLVMGFGSGTVTGGASLVDSELVKALRDFSAAARRVALNPARAIRETVSETSIARLRPNATTFRQYARMPAAQRLMGRVMEETANIADNGYLRHMVQVCERLARTVGLTVRQQADSFATRAQMESERNVTYLQTESRSVDPEIFSRQQDELKEKLDRVTNFVDENDCAESGRIRDYRLFVSKRYSNNAMQLFFNKVDGESTYDKQESIEFNVIEIPSTLVNSMLAALSFSNEYTLRGIAKLTVERTQKGKLYRLVRFSHVASVTAHTHALENKQRKRASLEKNAWRIRLSKQEREEMWQEARTAKLRGKVYLQRAERAVAAAVALKDCRAELHRQEHIWRGAGVAPRSAFPMGMRYIQSPDYAACLTTFNQVQSLAKRSGIGDAALDELDRIGILHASAIYERWCMVKIISVLIEDYGFSPQPSWQDHLIRVVTGVPQSLCLTFQREDIAMVASLEIQPIFPNGRRPDFRLRFSGSQSSSDQTKGIVMDAKFRTRWQKGGLTSILDELISGKNYGQLGDRVFILQPADRTVTEATSPLDWGQSCDYGQDTGQEHRKGAIHLAPGKGAKNPLVNLRRLIAMEIQSAFSEPEIKHNLWISESFCIRCGKKHMSTDIDARRTRKGQNYWSLNCAACGMRTIRTHCFAPDCRTVLFKNGTYLTYHKTLADQITNVACPSCGSHFDLDWSL